LQRRVPAQYFGQIDNLLLHKEMAGHEGWLCRGLRLALFTPRISQRGNSDG